IPRIASAALLGIDQANNVVKRGRFTPAFVPPIASVIGEHASEVANSRNARSLKGGPCICISPASTTIGGFENEVRVGMRKTTATFVHAGDVKGSVTRHITGDLHVANKGSAVDDSDRTRPCVAIVGKKASNQGPRTHVKVVQGNVHSSKERRGWVVVSPARLTIVTAAIMNAEVRPAVWILRIGRLVSA